MTPVRKAIIPAAGLGTRQYPATQAARKEFFPLADRDGLCKPAIQIVVEEALAGGAEEVCIVCQPGAEEEFRRYFRAMPQDVRPRFAGKDWAYEQSDRLERFGKSIHYIIQERQEGLGHAIWCAREWAGGEPVLAMLGDHVYVSTTQVPCAAQLTGAYDGGNLTALVPVGPEQLARFGIARGRPADGTARRIVAEGFVEKPDEATARARCRIDGLPPDTYLAHFGMHVFSPGIFGVLDEMVRAGRRDRGEFQLTTAQDILCKREPYAGLVMDGVHYDIGTPTGMLEAQFALALSGRLSRDVQRIWRRALENHLR
jgi:UTP--glucose-1-phosphate uridylyltransferase